ncbi:trehalose-phosphatase [Pelagibacterium limicola]|uniref:trehalose-phosphatase n=1 Tax=Pelagibacterium limicola TaxID=2791022 RepID=UPI0018AFC3C5|nr:trehalose-phosphatase [Pelagibacterium limicola]
MTNTISAILSAYTDPVALFIDFDGTLVEIAPQPDAIHVPGALIDRLVSLERSLDGALALVTGRTIGDIDRFLSAHTLTISGSHGLERRHRGQTVEPPAHLSGAAEAISTLMARKFGEDERILIERKPAGVAVHYRAAPERGDEVRAEMAQALTETADFHMIDGKKVVEARPAGTDKGTAIAALMAEPPFSGRTPVFIGDDVTDEDGFRAVNAMGGIGIKVGEGDTAARFRLPDVGAVHELLEAFADGEADDTQETN